MNNITKKYNFFLQFKKLSRLFYILFFYYFRPTTHYTNLMLDCGPKFPVSCKLVQH